MAGFLKSAGLSLAVSLAATTVVLASRRDVRESLAEDLANAREHDPAARNDLVTLLGYPGLHAIWAYRGLHRLWRKPGGQVPARLLSQAVRTLTGVEIHPGAAIGRRFFIDHAAGVVIGETTEIGDGVMLYQGVTLGGRSLEQGKRHPTLGDDVVIGAGAKVIGPVVIGPRSAVGANAVVVKDVPADSVAVGVPATVKRSKEATQPEHDALTDPAIWI